MIPTPGTSAKSDPRSDAQLVAASISDVSAFDVVFVRHAAAILRFAAVRVGPVHAEDIAAETFITAFDRRSRFDHGSTSARPWLYGIAANKLLQHRDAEHRWLERNARAHLDDTGDPDADRADERIEARRLAPELAAALLDLSPSERDVVLLVVLEELSHAEVAKALGIRRGAAKTRLSRGLARLRNALGDIVDTRSEEHDA